MSVFAPKELTLVFITQLSDLSLGGRGRAFFIALFIRKLLLNQQKRQ
jgi:hypothetical protein